MALIWVCPLKTRTRVESADQDKCLPHLAHIKPTPPLFKKNVASSFKKLF